MKKRGTEPQETPAFAGVTNQEMEIVARVAFIGLGNMGGGMAANLAKAGHDVRAFDLSQDALDKAKAAGCLPAASAAEAVAGAEAVITMLPAGRQVEATYTDVLLENAAPGTILIDCSTIDVDTARRVAQAATERGLMAVDAPVSGGQAGAENGVLTVMCGGEPATYARVEPVIAAYARMCRLMGPAGSGQLTKMVNQICIAGLVQALSEGIHFAKRAGLDVETMLEVISKGAAGSWQMENRGKTMNQDKFDFGFAVDWMRKDLGIVLDEGRRNGAQLPVTALVDQFYADVQKMGGNRWDTSSLIARLQR